MEQLNMNCILNRIEHEKLLKQKLMEFEANKENIQISRGFYVFGNPGTGKTEFVKRVLNDLNYSIIMYDAGDIRNKSIINAITKHNISDKSVISMFQKKQRPSAIIMDEIDGMNNGDKGGITSLIKLIRAKKTKKQKLEDVTMIPIICIGSMHTDKKIKELIKVCTTFHIKPPTYQQIQKVVCTLMPKLETSIIDHVIKFIDGDLRKVKAAHNIYKEQQHLLKHKILNSFFQSKTDNEDTKSITKYLINNKISFNKHTHIINETDRTSVGLLFHENIIDTFTNKKLNNNNNEFYLKFLNNICYADYIDRITFQKQIWIFNEISSLMKTVHNNNIFHNTFLHKDTFEPDEVRFTKVLTKYSTEYNNAIFIETLCEKLNLDKNDLLSYFLSIRYDEPNTHSELFESLEISKLDVNRIYRFIDNYTLGPNNT